MERADQSTRHDQRVELDLSNPADTRTDASEPCDTIARSEGARYRDEERAILVNLNFVARSLFLRVIFFVSF